MRPIQPPLRLHRQITRGLLALALGLLAASSLAASAKEPPATKEPTATAQLQRFMATTTTFKALFVQTLVDKSQGPVGRSHGMIYIARPARLRLDYHSPIRKQVVADGSTVTSYDHERKQFSQGPQETLFADTPARLLTAGEPIDKYFNAKDEGERDGFAWVELTPKDEKSPVRRIRVGFQIRLPARLELEEKEGAVVQIDFLRPHINEAIPDTIFRSEVPPSYDVLKP